MRTGRRRAFVSRHLKSDSLYEMCSIIKLGTLGLKALDSSYIFSFINIECKTLFLGLGRALHSSSFMF